MRKIVSPLDGVTSPMAKSEKPVAFKLLASEAQGLALDFLTNTSAIRTQ